jgi:hypothetical protein
MDVFEKAQWIWPDGAEGPNQYVCFRQCFNYDGDNGDVRLYISADSDFIAYINGSEAGMFQFPDYPRDKKHSVFPAGGMLRKGLNVFAALVYYRGEDFSTYRKGPPGLLVSIRCEKGALLVSDSSWKCAPAPFFKSGPAPKTTPQLGFTICADGRKLDPAWTGADYDDSSWAHPAPRQLGKSSERPLPPLAAGKTAETKIIAQGFLKRGPAGDDDSFAKISAMDALLFRPQSEVFEAESIGIQPGYEWMRQFPILGGSRKTKPAISISPPDGFNGYFVICDTGEPLAGLLTFSVTAPAGAVLDISHGEHLDDGRVRCNPGRRNFTDRYICAEGFNSFTFPFRRVSGKYIEIHITETGGRNLTLHYAGIIPLDAPLPQRGEFFKCGDALAEKVHEAAVRTLHLCMHDHYEDCPWREQALYSYDSRNQALYGYYLWGNYAFAAASFDLLGAGLRDDGFLELCAPARVPVVIPMFSFAWIAELYEHYLHSGDASLIERHKGRINSIIEKALSNRDSATGLCLTAKDDYLWHFYEWTDGLDGGRKPRDGFVLQAGYNIYLCEALRAAGFNAEADALKKSINSVFWDEQEGLYASWINPDSSRGGFHEHIQAVALFNGLPDESMSVSAAEKIISGKTPPITTGAMCYLLRAMMDISPETRAAVSRRIAGTFEPMVLGGSLTLWETAAGANDFSGAGSLCHGWSSIPAYYYNRYVLGVEPLEPGFKKFRIAPYPDRFYHAEGRVPTPHGDIAVEWRRDGDGRLIYRAEGPAGLEPELTPYPETEIVSAEYNSSRLN